MVIAQAGGQGYRGEVPNTFKIKSFVGFFLFFDAGQHIARRGFLVAPVDAVFQGVFTEDWAVEIDVGTGGAQFRIQIGSGVGMKFVAVDIHVVNIGFGLADKAEVGAEIFEIGGVLFENAVARTVVGSIAGLAEIKLFAQGAGAVGFLLAVA